MSEIPGNCDKCGKPIVRLGATKTMLLNDELVVEFYCFRCVYKEPDGFAESEDSV